MRKFSTYTKVQHHYRNDGVLIVSTESTTVRRTRLLPCILGKQSGLVLVLYRHTEEVKNREDVKRKENRKSVTLDSGEHSNVGLYNNYSSSKKKLGF
jgi:hypothetical protein